MESAEEWEEILELYQQFPMTELIIHPRLQREFYAGKPHREAFDLALSKCTHSLCYNGDIFTKADYDAFRRAYPQVEKVMIGRGFLVNPGLYREITRGQKMTKDELKAFLDRLYREYQILMGEEKNAMFKMKELWSYMQYLFISKNMVEIQNSDAMKYLKQIRKANRGAEYEAAVNGLFRECAIREDASFEG